MKFKKTKESTESTSSKQENKKDLLVALLKAKTPVLFDREPVLTGDVNKLADDILELIG